MGIGTAAGAVGPSQPAMDVETASNEFRTGVGAHWPFLSDPRRVVQKDLDIAEYTDPTHNPMNGLSL